MYAHVTSSTLLEPSGKLTAPLAHTHGHAGNSCEQHMSGKMPSNSAATEEYSLVVREKAHYSGPRPKTGS